MKETKKSESLYSFSMSFASRTPWERGEKARIAYDSLKVPVDNQRWI